MQVNSLGLTEAQPENNVYRIALEALAVTLGRNARARALQLPAWNEALGLPRPWDQQWSLRLQQILAYETDLLEYPDIFEGSHVMEALVAELVEGARAEMAHVAELGGAVEAVDYMKGALVESHRERWSRIESGEQTVVGMNRFDTTEPSPLTARWRRRHPRRRSRGRGRAARRAASAGAPSATTTLSGTRSASWHDAANDPPENIMPATIAAARAGVTTGEWSQTLREVFGEYRAPTGVGERLGRAERRSLPGPRGGRADLRRARAPDQVPRRQARARRPLQRRRADRGPRPRRRHGRRLRGHPPDAAQIAASAAQEGVHVIGLSILSGSHAELIPAVLSALGEAGAGEIPVVVGGIIPELDAAGTARGRGRGRLHAEGLGPEPDDRATSSRS